MNEPPVDSAFLILLVVGIIVINMLVKSALQKTSVPALVGYLWIGVGLRFVHGMWDPCLTGGCLAIFEFMAKIGLITLGGIPSKVLGAVVMVCAGT